MASIQSKRLKSGKKTFYVVVSLGTRHKWLKAGSLKDAKLLKKAVEGMAESERLEKLGISQKERRIDAVFQEYLDFARLRTAPNTAKRYRAVLNCFLTFLKMFHANLRNVSQIKQEHIEHYQQTRLQSVELKQAAEAENQFSRKDKLLPKPQTVNYEVGVLRSVFLWAQERGLLAVVPTEKVKKLRAEPKKQARILSQEECKQFLRAARELARSDKRMRIYALAFKFLLNTGLRSGELCNLTWEDVNLDSGLIKIRPKEGWTPKSYSREFFLNQAALKVLGRFDKSAGYVFVDEAGRQLDNDGMRNALIKVAREAGFDDFTRVHDLRHTFNSLMQMAGVDPATMGKIKAGTAKHSLFGNEVKKLGDPALLSESSFKGGKSVSRNTVGAKRPDVVRIGQSGAPNAAYDLKTGNAKLAAKRIAELRDALGCEDIPIIEIRPDRVDR